MDYDEVPPETAQMKEVNGQTICGNCREAVSPNATTCPHCQANLDRGDSGSFFLLIVGLLLGGTAFNLVRMVIWGDADAINLLWAVMLGGGAYGLIRLAFADFDEDM